MADVKLETDIVENSEKENNSLSIHFMLSTSPYCERHVLYINDLCYVNSLGLGWSGVSLQYAIGCLLLDTTTVVLK